MAPAVGNQTWRCLYPSSTPVTVTLLVKIGPKSEQNIIRRYEWATLVWANRRSKIAHSVEAVSSIALLFFGPVEVAPPNSYKRLSRSLDTTTAIGGRPQEQFEEVLEAQREQPFVIPRYRMSRFLFHCYKTFYLYKRLSEKFSAAKF